MAVLALAVAGVLIGLVWHVWWTRARFRDLQVEVINVRAIAEAEQILAQSLGRRRWSVIKGGKALALLLPAGCAALVRHRQVVTAATAGVAAGTFAFTGVTTEMSKPMPPAEAAPAPPVLAEAEPHPAPATTVPELVAVAPEPVPPIEAGPPTPTSPSTTVKSTTTTSSTMLSSTTTLLDELVTTTTAVTAPSDAGQDDENGRPVNPPLRPPRPQDLLDGLVDAL